MTDHLLLAPWPGGAPPFDRFRVDEVVPAIEAGIAAHRAELAAIADDPRPAGFATVIEPLERAGAALGRARAMFWTVAGACSTPAIRAIEPEVSALLAAHATAIGHDARLFARVAAAWAAGEPLDEERRRLLRRHYHGFIADGAELDATGKRRFAAIEARLSALSVRFRQNVLAAAEDWELALDGDDLDGLPETALAAARAKAAARGIAGALFTLGRGDVETLLSFSSRRAVRERVWRAFTGRCDGGAHDNNPIVAEIVALRREKAALLGYPSYAAFKLEDEMAATPEAAAGLMERVWPAARAQAIREADVMSARTGRARTGDDHPIVPWDWRYLAEIERRERHGADAAAVRAALPVERVAAAAFEVAGALFGLRFEAAPGLPGWHADVVAYRVTEEGGGAVGLLYLDLPARAGKGDGAWMSSLRAQERIDGRVDPVVSICCNFAGAGLSIDEARTFFHEFGHALHGLLSDVTYPGLAGTAVARDFVEFPSKLMENWIVSPAVLTGLGMPADLAAAVGRSDAFGEGFAMAEFLLSGLVDMAIHASTDAVPDVAAIEAATLALLDPPPGVAMRHRLPHFTHLFDGGYAAAYYGYLWSEVLDADAWRLFAGDVLDPAPAARYRTEILARGDARDPAESFRAFTGRDPDEAALLRARGFATAEAA